MNILNIKQLILTGLLLLIATHSHAGLGSWTSNGPDGGQVIDIVADPITPNTFYATAHGGVYKTIDGAVNWQSVNNGITTNFVNKIAHHPSMSGIVYLTSNNSVYKTVDGGLNWNVMSAGLPPSVTFFSDIEVAPLASETLYVGTNSEGIYKSTNGGLTWFAANTGLVTSVNALKISPVDTSRVYAAVSGTLNGLYESVDGGMTWLDVSGAIPAPYNSGDPVLNVEYAGFAGEIYIATYSGVYKSSDDGVTWVHSNNLIGNNIAVNPSNSNEVFVSGFVGLWQTTNGGVNWSHILADFIGNDNNEVSESSVVIYNPFNPTIKFAGTSGNGVYRQTNASPDWLPQVTGMNSKNIRGLSVANYPDMSSRVFAGAGDIFSPSHVNFFSDDQGLTWSQSNNGFNGLNFREIEVDPLTTSLKAYTHVYAVGRDITTTTSAGNSTNADGGIYKSVDGGVSWATIDNGIPLNMGPPTSSLFGTVRDISLDLSTGVTGGPAQVLYVAGSGKFTSSGVGPAVALASRIYKSTNAGATWVASDTGIAIPDSAEIFPYPAAVKIEIDQNNPLNLYAATFLAGYNSALPSSIENGVWKSIDAGATWTLASSGLPTVAGVGTSNYDVLSLAIDPTNSSRLYASVHNPDTLESQIYKTEDSALTWTIANAGIATSDVRDILVASNGDVYAAASGNAGNPGGVYRSQDFGVTWQSMSIGLNGVVSVTQLDIDETGVNSLIYAGSRQSVQSFEIVPDGDTDGVPDITENSAPNAGDGNNDGLNDSGQNNVSSLPTSPVNVTQIRHIFGASNFATIDVTPIMGACDTLEDVQALTDTNIPDDPNRSFEFGVIRFEILNCEQATVTITFHGASDFLDSGWGYRIFAPVVSGETQFFWQDMPSSVSGNVWTLSLSDGQFGDVRPNNGRILFQGGPANFDNSIFSDSFE